MKIVMQGNPLWDEAAELIQAVYRDQFDAQIQVTTPRLAIAQNPTGEVICAAGMRYGEDGFFSDHYADKGCAFALSQRIGTIVHRDQLVEVVNMAGRSPTAALSLLDFVTETGSQDGKSWGIFTATRPLRVMLERRGLKVLRLCPAERARVSNPEIWGRYYDTAPELCAIYKPTGQALGFDPRHTTAITVEALAL